MEVNSSIHPTNWKHFIMLGMLLCIFNLQTRAQNYPKDFFRYPLDSLPNLVSPFGGLRDNHFHSGVDLRTNGREGLPVYATADGYISRIKVQKNGYGKALYIEHANGYSTVYGHLSSYYGPLADWIRRYQYINKTFEFDKIFIKPFLFVKQGDTIGFSGNSGGSTGPHLHYEIRDIKTEKTINPALFGLLPLDTLKPIIFKVHAYKFVEEGLLLKKQLSINAKSTYTLDSITILKDTLWLDPETYGFGVEAYDYIHNARDEKGIYQYALYRNNTKVFTHTLNQFAFDESKYINAHIDFPYYKIEKNRIQKCFVDDGNAFSSYSSVVNRGRILFQENESGALYFSVLDNNQNVFYLAVPYKVGPSAADPDRQSYLRNINPKQAIYPGKAQQISAPGLMIQMDPKSVYDTVYYQLQVQPIQPGTFSEEYAFHTPVIPIHNAFDIAIKPGFYPEGLEKKLLLAYSHPKSESLRSAGGVYSNGWVRGKGSNFGNYCVVLDTVPPTIKPAKYKNEYNVNDTLRWDFEVKDNFSGIASYAAYLDSNWVLLDFDPKNNLLTYRPDEVYELVRRKLMAASVIEGEVPRASIRIVVEDAKGNVQERTFQFLLP